MGVENNECVIATTWDADAMQRVWEWIGGLSEDEQTLFQVFPSLANNKVTLFMAPDGSKKGWGISGRAEFIRDQLVDLLETFNYGDGSSPFNWIEVGYGEFGQKVLRGNCSNQYSDEDYAA